MAWKYELHRPPKNIFPRREDIGKEVFPEDILNLDKFIILNKHRAFFIGLTRDSHYGVRKIVTKRMEPRSGYAPLEDVAVVGSKLDEVNGDHLVISLYDGKRLQDILLYASKENLLPITRKIIEYNNDLERRRLLRFNH